MEGDENSLKERFKNSIAYIPWVALILFFVKQWKTPELEKNIRYWIYFMILYILSIMIISIFMFSAPIILIILFIYLVLSAVYAYLAYKWNDINISFIDKIHKFVENIGQ